MEISNRQRNMMLAVMMVGGFFSALSQSMLTAALPVVMDEFIITATLGQWLTTSYIMVLGIVTSMTAYLINRCHTQKLFISAMLLFLAGSLISLKAPSFGILLFARVMQAAGAGILLPLIQVIGFQTIPEENRGRAMGLMGLVIAFAPAIGPTISGVIVDFSGWRSIFALLSFSSVIIIAAALFFVFDVGEKIASKMDILSALAYGLAFSGIMLGVTNRENYGWFDPYTLGPAFLGLLLLVFFVRRQLSQKDPLLELRIFSNYKFAAAAVLNMISYLIMMSGTILVPIYIQTVRGLPALTSGLVLLPGSLLLALFSPVSGYLLDRYGPRMTTISGMILMAISAVSFSFFTVSTPIWIVTTLYAIRMVGVAAILMPLTAYGIGVLEKKYVAHGTAVVTSLRQMTGALGSAILVAIMSTASAGQISADIAGINATFAAQALVIIAGMVLAFRWIK